MKLDPSQIAHRAVFSGLRECSDGETIVLEGPEAHHAATVKRRGIGDAIGLLDGQGTVAAGIIRSITGHKTKPSVEIEISEVRSIANATRPLEIWTALPKGDRLDTMIDQLSQLGVTRWRALICDRSERKWGAVKADKLVRTTHESAKQCGRSWFMEIGDPIDFSDAIKEQGVVVADGNGVAASEIKLDGTSIVLVGPEGGWSDSERAAMNAESVQIVRLGGHVLRLETAACCAAAVLMDRVQAGDQS